MIKIEVRDKAKNLPKEKRDKVKHKKGNQKKRIELQIQDIDDLFEYVLSLEKRIELLEKKVK